MLDLIFSIIVNLFSISIFYDTLVFLVALVSLNYVLRALKEFCLGRYDKGGEF